MQHVHTWEAPLISLASADNLNTSDVRPIEDISLVNRAYRYCDEVTAHHSRSFHLSSGLLAGEKRRAARALYAFCRTCDDIVDRPSGDTSSQLRDWQKWSLAAEPPTHDLTLVAWADARARFNIPRLYAEQLIDGVSQDLVKKRYETFDELADYAYKVASTVGLMSMHIIGYAGKEAIPYAIKLGVALQLTNILRDVGEDWRNGRIYLPQDELADFGLSEADIAAGRVTDTWRSFMQFQIDRNRRLYTEAWPGIKLLNKDGQFAIAAAAEVYRAILTDIEDNDYDVFSRRAYVSTWGKISRLLLMRLRGWRNSA
ncbi:MAG: squalene/phytoene synthase family protein [Chloroflexi bacterium]|nr:squalene/phytoene synthase family protein [Chloroflexota bacterium]